MIFIIHCRSFISGKPQIPQFEVTCYMLKRTINQCCFTSVYPTNVPPWYASVHTVIIDIRSVSIRKKILMEQIASIDIKLDSFRKMVPI